MILNNINLEELSRDEYINLIFLIICAFKLDYEYFTDIEKNVLINFLDGKLIEWNKKI